MQQTNMIPTENMEAHSPTADSLVGHLFGRATESMTSKISAQESKASRAEPDSPAIVLRRFRVIFSAVRGHFRAVERKAGITGAQAWSLSVIHAKPGLGVNELARSMDIHQSTASNLLRPLVETGLVSATRGGKDRRAVQLTVTTNGSKVLSKAPAPFTGVLPEALAKLDARTLARLERDLAHVITLLRPSVGKNIPLGDRDAY
jgi:DNA-binding MarR family transcriptional regulator